jgi:formylglycine-generating enzyme required for sulfatase activity
MAGNVWEWVADLYRWDYYSVSPASDPSGPNEPGQSHARVIRGGSFQDSRLDIRLSNRGFETGPNPGSAQGDPARGGNASVKIGFRCTMDD